MIRENWGASVGYACAQDGGNVREMVRRMVIYANLFADRSMGYERSIQRKGAVYAPRLRKQSRVKFRLMTE